MEVNIHEAANVWEVLCPPWMHEAVNGPKVWFANMGQEQSPEHTLKRSISKITIKRIITNGHLVANVHFKSGSTEGCTSCYKCIMLDLVEGCIFREEFVWSEVRRQ